MKTPPKASLFLFFIVCILCAIASEVILRLVLPVEPLSLATPMASVYGWAMPPFGRVKWRAGGEVFVERLNSEGFRDVEHELEKFRKRILFIGDSYTAGIGIKFENLYTRQLQEMLSDSIEIISMGIGGIGTDQELLILKHQGLAYQPDIVVLQFYTGNDPLNNLYDHLFASPNLAKPYFYIKNGELQQAPFTIRRDLKRILLDYRLVNSLNTIRHLVFDEVRVEARKANLEMDVFDALENLPELAVESDYSPYCLYLPSYSDSIRYAWQLTEALLVEMKKTVEAHHAIFMIFPALWQLDTFSAPIERTVQGRAFILYPERALRELRNICLRNGIVLLDIADEFRKACQVFGIEKYFIPGDNHWNAAGHALVAELLSRKFNSTVLF